MLSYKELTNLDLLFTDTGYPCEPQTENVCAKQSFVLVLCTFETRARHWIVWPSDKTCVNDVYSVKFPVTANNTVAAELKGDYSCFFRK